MISLGRSARTPSWCDSAQPAPPEPSTSAAPPVRAKWSGGRKSSSASRTVTGSFAAPVRRVPRLAIEEISPNVLARSSSSSKDRRPRRRRWGHDYGTIEQKGFRKLCVERDGAPSFVDNPRWV